MIFQIGDLKLGDQPDGPDPGPKSATWHKANIVEVKPIPGKGKKFKTTRTSDQTLDECTLVVRSITKERYAFLKYLCDLGGPFVVLCNHGLLKMYIVDREIQHDENDKEMPLRVDPGDENSPELNVATWTIKLQEAND